MKRSSEIPTLTTNFAVSHLADSQTLYSVRRFPRLGAMRRGREDGHRKEPNVRVARSEMEKTLSMFQEDAEKAGLEIGRYDPSIRILRVKGVGFGPSRKNPDLQPAEAVMRIDDDKGNSLQFRLVNQPDFVDAQGRQWDARVVALIEQAVINGKREKLSYEMTHNGFVFFTKGMPEILEQAKYGKQPTMTVRQETPDAVCFVDGHHTFIGNHDLGCYCKEEREASLAIIHQKGGVSALMPGTGNGNGTEVQDMQNAVRYSAARRGATAVPSYLEIFPRMGKKGDNRHTTLKISTILLEHLFQAEKVENITTLTESRTKQDVWHEFSSAHTVKGESLHVTPPNHVDSQYKQNAYGYTAPSDHTLFPLQPR